MPTSSVPPVAPAVNPHVAATAQKLGLDPNHVHTQAMELKQLRERGSLVAVTVRGTSRLFGSARMRDYGVGSGDIRVQRLTPGMRALFTKARAREISNAEASIRRCLDKHSYDVAGFRPYRYMLDTARPIWLAEHAERVARFDAGVQALIDAYADEREQAADVYEQMARKSYQALRATLDKDAQKAQQVGDREQFVKLYVQVHLDALPKPKELRAAMGVEVHAAVLLRPAEIEELLTEQAAQALETTRLREAALTAHHAEEEHRRLVTEQLRDELSRLESPWTSMLQEYEHQLYEDAQDLLTQVTQQGHLLGSQKTRLERMKAMYEVMAISKREPVEQALALLERALQELSPEEQRKRRTEGKRVKYDMDALGAGLKALAAATHDNAEAFRRARPTPFAALEV